MPTPRIRLLVLPAAATIALLAPALSAPAAVTTQRLTPDSVISTIAGTGVAGFSGNGGQAARALLRQPRDTAVGPDGSIYVADTRNNQIRRIAPGGTISAFAGTGVAGFSGDGGQARQARLTWPHDVAVDAAGNVYVADSNNHRIRKITTAGIISTVAGTGTAGFNGDNQPARQARLRYPKSVALHSGALYIADSLNQRIRKVNLTTGIITTVAGNGQQGYSGDGGQARSASFNTPQRVAIDSAGNIYITDTKNNRVRVVTAATGRVRTVAGTGQAGFGGDGGPATAARINTPRGIALAGNSTLYIADSGNHRIRRVNLESGYITTAVGTGTAGYSGDGGRAGSARVYGPRGLTVDGGRLIIADTLNNVIRVVKP